MFSAHGVTCGDNGKRRPLQKQNIRRLLQQNSRLQHLLSQCLLSDNRSSFGCRRQPCTAEPQVGLGFVHRSEVMNVILFFEEPCPFATACSSIMQCRQAQGTRTVRVDTFLRIFDRVSEISENLRLPLNTDERQQNKHPCA